MSGDGDEILKALPIPDAVFYIRNKASSKVLHLTPSNAILLQDKSDDDNQKWMFTKRGAVDKKKGVYSIANLERLNTRLGYTSPHKVDTRVEGKDDLILWTIWAGKNNTFQFNTGDPVCVMDGSSPSNRINLQEEAGTPAQLWELVVVPSAPTSKDTEATPAVKLSLGAGHKYFIRNWHDSLLLTIGNKSVNDKATDEVYVASQVQTKLDPKSPLGQIWSVNVKAGGKFEVYNTAARKYLAIPEGGDSMYKEVLASDDATEWFIKSVGGFSWTITSAATGLAVGFPSAKPQSSDKTFLVPNNTAQNQIWFFEEVTDSAASDLATKIANLQISRVVWGAAITTRSGYRLRNKASNLVLVAGPGQQYRISQNWYWFHMDVDSVSASYYKWNIYEVGSTREFTIQNPWCGHYSYSSDGYFYATNDSSMRWTFAEAAPGYYYISFTKDNSPRKVIGTGAFNALAPIVDFKDGDASQMWALEPV